MSESTLTSDELLLMNYMSELSEEAYEAGWMAYLEFALWRSVINGPTKFGRLDINNEHISELKRLSAKCGGWIVWDDIQEETFVKIEDWTKLYNSKVEKLLKEGQLD